MDTQVFLFAIFALIIITIRDIYIAILEEKNLESASGRKDTIWKEIVRRIRKHRRRK